MKKLNGFTATGKGPLVNGVRIEYSCGKEGYQEITAAYSKRRQGYGKPKHSWKSLLRVMGYLGPDKWLFVLVTFITVGMIFINLFSAFLAAPLVDAVLQPAVYSITGNWIIGGSPEGYYAASLSQQLPLYGWLFNLVDWHAAAPYEQAFALTGILIGSMMAVYVVGFLLSSAQVYLMTKIGSSALMRLRNEMFDKLQKLPLRYFDQTPHGDTMSRFTNDVDALAQLFNTGIMEIFTSVVLMAGILIFIFLVNWLLALVVCMMELAAAVIVSFNVHRSVGAFSETQVSMGEFNGIAEEALSGLKVVKCFNKEEDMARLFKSIDYVHTIHNRRSVFLSSCNVPIVNNINNMATAITIIVGSLLIVVGADWGFSVTAGTLLSYVVFMRMLARPINSISNLLTAIQASLAGAERIFQMVDQPPEPSLQKAKWHSYKAEDGKFYWTDGTTVKPVRGEVEMNHVSFSYLPGQKILDDITMYAHPGQKIALVGSTGAGKTTITNLLTRFYDIDSGEILIDGIDIKDIDRVSMRRSMTLVLQDTHLFSGTIYDNIRFGHLKASDADCEEAARIACADSFIRKLKKGYDTFIDAHNASLSQGQRQLLSIARCAVSNPPILILDEATSSIDTRTERLISKGMENIMKGKTTFVIAHRLSTIRYADCIMVMDHGRIIERGNHEQLLSLKGRYYELWTGKAELD